MRRILGIVASLAALCVHAQQSYRPEAEVSGTIRIAGHPYMAGVVQRWAEGFARFHPNARIEPKLTGSDTAIPLLYSANADIAILGRANNVTDDNGFLRPKQYRFTRVELMNGSLDVPGKSDALVVFVHKDNPLARLTMDELDAIFGCERRRGHGPIATWGDLGLRGDWAARPIHMYTYDADTGTGRYFQDAVLRQSRKMPWERITEFADKRRDDRSVQRAGEQIVAALRADRYGIAVSSFAFAAPDVKAIAIARDSDGPYVMPSRETIVARTYPLARRTYAFVDVGPGKSMDAKVREFIRYALSREGQADVARDGGYLPLDAPTIAAQERGLAVAFVDSLPLYRPTQKVAGTVTLWGHGSYKRDFMGNLVGRWIETFRKQQPDVKFVYKMYGTASAIGALATGAGNLALLGEEISPEAATMFRRAKGYAPTGIEVATGSLDVNFFDYAHMVFVNRDNPVTKLTLQQLDAIFGAEHRRGPKNIRTWGELGLGGEWADRRIQPYAWKVDEDFALFFREAVLENSHRWNPDTKEYVHVTRPDGTQYDHGQQILDALAKDPRGIAISNVRYSVDGVRPLALAKRAGEPYYEPTLESLISQDYPLVRIIPAYVDRAPGQPVEPAVREFLRFMLSREGQRALVDESGYLPLGPKAIQRQLEKLQ